MEPNKGGDGVTPPNTPQNIDYKAMLEAEQKRNETLSNLIRRHKEKKEEPDDRDEVEKRINENVEARLSAIEERAEKRIAIETAKMTIRASERDQARADLIIHHLEHSIQQTPSMEENIRRARAMVDYERLAQENAELRRGSNPTPPQGGAPGATPPTSQKPNHDGGLSPEEISFAQKFGVKPEDLNNPKYDLSAKK